MVFYPTAGSTKEPSQVSYMQAYEMWKTFDVSERVDNLFSRARRDVTERHNEEVRQNREMPRTLSEALSQETFYKSLLF